MTKRLLISLTFLFATGAQAECLHDSWEIRDTGPGSSRIYETLKAKFPTSELTVAERKILATDEVSVIVTVDGELQTLDYRLYGADWIQEKLEITSNR